MNYGRYVGRVGALAAALGIGIAVASSPAVAWADPDSSSSSGTDHQSTAAGPADNSEPPASAPADSEATPDAPTDAEPDDVDDEDDGELAPDDLDNLDPPDENVAEEDPDGQSAAHRTDRRSSRGNGADASTVIESAVITAEEIDDEFATALADDLDEAVENVDATAPVDEEAAELDESTVRLSDEAESAPPADAQVSETVVVQLGATLGPLKNPAPEIPADSQIIWALLGSAHRPTDKRSSGDAALLSSAVVNSAPTVTSTFVGFPKSSSGKVRGQIRATDPDRDRLTHVASAPAKGTVTIKSSGRFSYIPTAAARHAAAGTSAEDYDRFTVTTTDGNGGSVQTVIDVAIGPANSKPSARATVGQSNPATGAVTGKITATDRDGDGLVFSGSGATPKGNVVVKADGTFVYTPTAEARAGAGSFSGRSDRFTATVNDGHGGIDTVTVRVRITTPDSNQGPSVGNPGYVISTVATSDGKVTGGVIASDPEGFSLTYTLSAAIPSSTGVVTVNATTGAFTFTPTVRAREIAHGTPGEDTVRFTVTVSDGLDSAAVDVTAPISAKAPPPPPPPPPSGLRWPLASVSVNRYFGGNGHNGIDLNAGMRTPVYAAADGVISFEGYGQNHSWMREAAGICILVWHPSLNIYTGYAHLSSTIINNGQTVSRGQLIGYSGSTGNSTGPHLHFEVLPRTPNFSNGYAGRIDPLPYIR
ncbi:MAG: peptidoglycan DD-metalloendopeptidase family protein [Mycobacterium sp.]|nr:peptidoglycan DD-metalloendopeptidase family protein [Mycobacterium sp.]